MSIIPQFIVDAALAADRATEHEWENHKEKVRRFENKIIGVCAGMLAGIWLVYALTGMVR